MAAAICLALSTEKNPQDRGFKFGTFHASRTDPRRQVWSLC